MGFRTLDLDNKEQAEEYKKSKKHAKFVKENKARNLEVPSEPVEEIKQMTFGKVRGVDQLRLRIEPEGEIIGLINRGKEVEVLEHVDDIWCKVRVLETGAYGYVMNKFLITYVDGDSGFNDLRRCKPCPTTI